MQTMKEAFSKIGADFNFAPFGQILQPLILEVLRELGLNCFRKGTILVPQLLMWLVLMLSIRRDLAYNKVLNWMVSGFRWLQDILPAKNQPLKDGTISKARIRLGLEPFRLLFNKLRAVLGKLPTDFYHWVSVGFDGTTASMPDTEENEKHFKKPPSRNGSSAFPKLRMMVLQVLSLHLIIDIDYAPYTGKKTGERTLMMNILGRIFGFVHCPMLFLMDAGLYSFDALLEIKRAGHDLICKVSSNIKLNPIKYLPDGSYLAIVIGQVEDLESPPRKDGKRRWKLIEIKVRVIIIHIPGYPPKRLITTILDPNIKAREIALHYHVRWEIEITYDEIKTHQCATLRGQLATTFRSKRPDLVQQELYATVIMYNVVRLLIWEAAQKEGLEARFISFVDSLQHIIDAAPIMTALSNQKREEKFDYLLRLIADCNIDRPRRNRVNERVVKVKMSSYRRKKAEHKSLRRNLADELTILFPPGFSLNGALHISIIEFKHIKKSNIPKFEPDEIITRQVA